MTEIDLNAITRRLEIIKAESSQGVSISTPAEVKAAAVEQIGPRLQAVLDAGVLGIEA